MAKQCYSTNYDVAVNWCNNQLILCNDIYKLDDSVYENMEPVYNLTFDEDAEFEEDDEGNTIYGYTENNEPITDIDEARYENTENWEIFQWYLTDCSDFDAKYLRETFGLWFTYSNMLGLYVLLVPHWGTSWDYVGAVTTNEFAERKLGEKK